MAKRDIKNILVVAITRMGDMLQASPSLVGLKNEYPNAKITVFIERQFASICDGIPGIDETIPVDLSLVLQSLTREGEGIVDAFDYFENVLADLRGRNFDMCINMSSSAYTALLVRLLNTPDNRGWVSDEEGFRIIENPWAMLFAAFVYHSNRDFNSINLVDILRCSAGVGKHPHSLVFQVPEGAKSFPEEFFRMKGITPSGPVIAIQAGASQEKRQWSPARFGYLAKELIEKLNATVVLTGSKSELHIANAILTSYSHPQLVSAVGITDLGQLSALLDRADLLVTGDTGTMHLAVAVQTPVVALFLASALCFETGPYSKDNIVLQPQIHCNPCNPNLPCSRPDCHDQVSPELVASLVDLRLKNSSLDGVTLSPALVDPRTVAVYATIFDADGFLDYRQMNGASARKGLSPEYFALARESYRAVWKSEFGGEIGLPRKDVSPMSTDFQPKNGVEASLQSILQLCDIGEQQLKELERYIKDRSAPARLLGEANAALNRTDQLLQDVGHAEGAVGALVRMFIMEKENLRGEDPLELTAATRALYQGLRRRSQLFLQHYQA